MSKGTDLNYPKVEFFHFDFLELHDIIYDIMTEQKLQNLWAEVNSLRKKGGIKSSELQSLAKAVGKSRHKKRGKEPTWISSFSMLPPVSIPDHSGDLNKFTARGILDQIERDLEKHSEILEKGK